MPVPGIRYFYLIMSEGAEGGDPGFTQERNKESAASAHWCSARVLGEDAPDTQFHVNREMVDFVEKVCEEVKAG